MLVCGDLLVFTVLFCVYAYYRADEPGLFHASQRLLNQRAAAFNTFVLLTSSWFMATAVHAARVQRLRTVLAMLAATFLCGGVFLAVKAVEYSEKIGRGITLITDDFFMFYFVMTGIHALHVTIGLGFIAFLFFRTRTAAGDSPVRLIETGATFWHMVDLLWLILYALLYLIK